MPDPRKSPLHLARPPASLSEHDDDALMLLAAGGHRDAFEALAGRWLPRAARYCAKFLGDPRAGDEVAQDVLVETWAQRARYRSGGRFQVLLFTIARNRCLNRARDDRRRSAAAAAAGAHPVPACAGAQGPDALDRLLEQERQRQVRDAVVVLPEKLREAVLLRFDQGLDYGEIARVVGANESTVRSRVFHALRRLRVEVGEEAP